MGAFDPSSFLSPDLTSGGDFGGFDPTTAYDPIWSAANPISMTNTLPPDAAALNQSLSGAAGSIPPYDPGFPTNTQPDYGPLPTTMPGGIGMPGTVAGVPTSPRPAGTLQQIWGAMEQGSMSQLPPWLRGVLNIGVGAGNILGTIGNIELAQRENEVLGRELSIMNMGQNLANQYARQIPSAQAGLTSDIAQLQQLANLTPQQVTGGIRQYETPGMQPEQNLTARLNQLQQLGNLTPSQVTGGIQQYLQPLNQNLISGINQEVARSLASQGMAQSPGMMSASTAQALAPWEQQNIQQAANQYFQQRGLQQQDIFTQIAAYQEDMIRAANEYFQQRGLQQQDIQAMMSANLAELGLPIEALNAIKYPNFFPNPAQLGNFIQGPGGTSIPIPKPSPGGGGGGGGGGGAVPVSTKGGAAGGAAGGGGGPTILPGPFFGEPVDIEDNPYIAPPGPQQIPTSSWKTVDPNTGQVVDFSTGSTGYIPYPGLGEGTVPNIPGTIPGGMMPLPNFPDPAGAVDLGGTLPLPAMQDLGTAWGFGSGAVPNIPGTVPGGIAPLPGWGGDAATQVAGAGGGGGGAEATSGAFKFGPWQIGGGLGQALSIASGVAMGAEIPLLALRIMGINPFSQAPSPQQIKLDDKVAEGVVNSGLKVINASGNVGANLTPAAQQQMKQQNTQRIVNQVKSSMQYMNRISSMVGHSPQELQTAQQSLMQAAYQNLAKLGYTPEQIANLLGGQGAATEAAAGGGYGLPAGWDVTRKDPGEAGFLNSLMSQQSAAQPTAPQYTRPAPPYANALNRLMAGGA